MTMIDVNAVLRAYLITLSALTDETGDQVYAVGLPEGFAETEATKAVAFDIISGAPQFVTPTQDLNIEFRCYGATDIEARAVYGALHDALHGKENVLMGTTRLWWAYEIFAGRDYKDDETNYPFVLCEYQLRMATQE